MDFTIPCDTFIRLQNILEWFPNDGLEVDHLKCVHLEYKNSHAYAIVTNRKLAAIEYLGKREPFQNASVNIALHQPLIDQCKIEAAFKSTLFISVNEMLKFASAKTTLGYNFPGNALHLVEDTQGDWQKWRTWVPDKPITKSVGAMFWNTEQIARLGKSSPSGSLAFPDFIDATRPVIVRDVVDENWLGVFMGNRNVDGKIIQVDGAELPDWFPS